MKFIPQTSSLVALFGAFLACHANAGVIIMPDLAYTTSIDGGTTPPMGSLGGFLPSQAINQSGLSSPYTTGVTDFDAYIASNPTHASSAGFNSWRNDFGAPRLGFFDIDLGVTVTLESMALWNFGGLHSENVALFDILIADNPDFNNATTLILDPANTNTGPSSAVLAQVFSFAPTSGRYVRMELIANNGSTEYTAFGEVAFEAIPEPSAVLLGGLGTLGLFLRRRRQA